MPKRPRLDHHAVSRRTLLFGAVATSLAGCLDDPPLSAAPDAQGAVDEGIVALPATGLERGVNLSWWLNLTGTLEPSDAELGALHAAGFTHVRLPVDPALLGWTVASGDTLPPRPEPLDQAISRILAARLDLILDVHPGDDLVAELAESDAAVALARLWSGLAARYAAYPVQRLVFETVNEPHRFVDDRSALTRVNAATLAAIRRTCPTHRVLVNGLFDTRLSLRTIDPLPDPNVVYAWQFYDPYVITHQGADWDSSELGGLSALRDVPYPASRMTDGWTLAAKAWFHPRALRLLADYGRKGWDAARVDAVVARAAAWSAEHDVPVVCTEFGVMRTYIDATSRLAWLPTRAGRSSDTGSAGRCGSSTACSASPAVARRARQPGCRQLDGACLDALGLAGADGTPENALVE